ncbi:hypothetical protein KR215_003355 [Drosophila sulfurigaster]|nr:hypothetical protein KR215_003355 [Drosophila sulfurigaster]
MNQSDLSGRLARWAIKLQGFSFDIEHRKVSENVVADALSRSFEEVTEITAVELELFPEINLDSDAFQSPEYLFGQHMTTHGQDFKLLRNLDLLSDGTEGLNRIDQFQKIRADIEKHLTMAYEKNQQMYNMRSRPRFFEVGQQVVKRNFALSNAATNFNAKLAPVGINARIKKKIGNSLYLLEDLTGKELGAFHAKDLW